MGHKESDTTERLSLNPLPPFVLCVAQSYLTLCDPMDCSPPGSSVHGVFQSRILEWVIISSSRGISQTQGSNQCFLCLLQILYLLSHQRNPLLPLVTMKLFTVSVSLFCKLICIIFSYK